MERARVGSGGTAAGGEATVLVRLLGGLRVEGPLGEVTRFRTQKTGGILGVLALSPGRAFGREELAERFWPGADPKRSGQSLRTALSALQRDLARVAEPARLIRSDRAAVWLDPAVASDAARFEAALAGAGRARRDEERRALLAAAVDAYGGPLLPGRYEPWVGAERERLDAAFLDALLALAGLEAAAGRRAAALDLLRRALAADPLREAAHVEVMRLLAEAGDARGARRQFDELEAVLQSELGVGPGPEALELRDRAAAAGAAAPPGLSPAPIPSRAAPLVGREEELARLLEAVAAGERLLTLTGPGGVGKTRLALELAKRLAGSLSGAVAFVPLEDVADAGELPRRAAEALGLRAAPGREPLDELAAALGSRRCALVLDNLEQFVPAAAAAVAALVERAPGVICVATSRRVLDVAGERELVVRPLATPSPDAGYGAIAASAAVRLYVDRARRVSPEFALTPANAASVARVVARLDGVPLALELAAAWARVLDPRETFERLERGLEAPDAAGRPARHRSMRAAAGGSVRLLGDAARALFARLSVFRGGWTLGAAGAVAGGGADVAGTLRDLRELSVVSTAAERGAVRFRMLGVFRELADGLLGAPERAALRGAHAEYFLDLAEQWEAKRHGGEESEWIVRLDAERENLRAALDWCLGEGARPADGLRLAARLAHFWHLRGYWDEGRDALERALAAAGGAPGLESPRARALWWLGFTLFGRGLTLEARARYLEGLELGRAAGDDRAVASALYALSGLAGSRGETREAGRWAAEGLEVALRAGDRRLEAALLVQSATLARDAGDLDRAEALLLDARALYARLGWGAGEGLAAYQLGDVARLRGEVARATTLLETSLALAREWGDEQAAALALKGLGLAARAGGDAEGAFDLLREAELSFRRLGERREAIATVEGLACAAADLGRFGQALALAGFAAREREETGSVVPPVERGDLAAAVAVARAAVGEREAGRAGADGRAARSPDAMLGG